MGAGCSSRPRARVAWTTFTMVAGHEAGARAAVHGQKSMREHEAVHSCWPAVDDVAFVRRGAATPQRTRARHTARAFRSMAGGLVKGGQALAASTLAASSSTPPPPLASRVGAPAWCSGRPSLQLARLRPEGRGRGGPPPACGRAAVGEPRPRKRGRLAAGAWSDMAGWLRRCGASVCRADDGVTNSCQPVPAAHLACCAALSLLAHRSHF